MDKQIILNIPDLLAELKHVNSKYNSINRILENLENDLKKAMIGNIEVSVFLNLLIEEIEKALDNL